MPQDQPILTGAPLPRDAFLRALPFTVDRATRLRLDALVYSADTIFASFNQLIAWALATAHAMLADGQEHSAIPGYQAAWSIVDHLHNMRQLLLDLKLSNSDVDAFIDRYEIARKLRNRMDHLGGAINNISKYKGSDQSLFGNLAHVIWFKNDDDHQERSFVVMHQTGAVQPGQIGGEFLVPADIKNPIGNFQLSAIGLMIDLDAAVEDAMAVMQRLNAYTEESALPYLKAKATELGRPEADLLAHYGASISAMFEFKVSSLSSDTK